MVNKAKLKKELQLLYGVRDIILDEPMSRHTSMGAGGTADLFIVPADVEELKRILAFFEQRKIDFMPLGNGSNLIVRDGGYRGALISLKGLKRIEIVSTGTEETLLYAEAGTTLSRLVDFSIEHSLGGIEFCEGIPGSLGGALKMNTGAYGGEMKDIVETIFTLRPCTHIEALRRDNLHFDYRCLNLPEGSIITGACIKLVSRSTELIKKRVEEIKASRKSKHPINLRSAGSIFRNPPGLPAGKLIEEAGLKGYQIGDAQISEMHGNFIVNKGAACARDIVNLIDMARKTVKEKTGILLETEVKIIGDEK
ncbi:MAG: UDP-N-acetylmuramate dehydrogenase [Syntrophales bacterium]|jgi:UDP-N-acetylmuramate dehydrogenase|nr:UDP-N-acetylmuramate dehydrogenase [Syntrophales bacterium]MDY0043053.1 UDP-N-acetylmuramate dehydrogenase [Syntrophales bacterium]